MPIPSGLSNDELREITREGELVPRSDVEEGEIYVYKWSPYDWAMDGGYEGVYRAKVEDVDAVGDIKLRTADNRTLTDLGENRRQVMGDASFNPDTPDHTDVGLGGRFYKPETRDLTTANELRARGHSWRNFEPEDFIEVAHAEGKPKGRELLHFVESDRFYPMLDAGHQFFRALDPDEKRAWAKANPELMEWIGVWGFLEDLNTYEEYTGVEQQLGL